jgi:hypothetical protein
LGHRTIRCTPDNAAEFQALVKSWPQLLSLVQSLQVQGLFPGLRGLSVTLSGPPQRLAQGIGALLPKNAPTAR